MTEMEKLNIMADFTIYIENTATIYNNIIMSVCNTLARKKFKGSYDDEKAKKTWYNVVNYGLQRYFVDVYQEYYANKYGNISAWHYLLTTHERQQIADELQHFYAEEVDFLTNRLIKEHEKPSFVGVVKSCQWQRNDINGNGIYKVALERCDSGNVVTGTSQHYNCFHGWLEGKKVKVFYHVTPKRKAIKFDDFKVL